MRGLGGGGEAADQREDCGNLVKGTDIQEGRPTLAFFL